MLHRFHVKSMVNAMRTHILLTCGKRYASHTQGRVRLTRTQRHASTGDDHEPRLFEVEPMVDVVRAHVTLDVREVLVQRPHGAVVGAGRVQRDHRARRPVRAQAVQHRRAACVAEVDRQVQRLARLQGQSAGQETLPYPSLHGRAARVAEADRQIQRHARLQPLVAFTTAGLHGV